MNSSSGRSKTNCVTKSKIVGKWNSVACSYDDDDYYRITLIKSIHAILKGLKPDDVKGLWRFSMRAWADTMKEEGNSYT